MYPNNLFQNTFSPQPGITVRYIKIPDIVDFVLSTPLDPNYKRMANLSFEANHFKVSFLSASELNTVNGFKAQKKQIEWVCGRFALKTLAREICCPGILLSDIQIAYHEKGAPFLSDHPDIPISLSHSGDYTAAAISQNLGTSMGIDVEKIKKKPDAFFMKTAFTQREILQIPPTAQEIYRHWTLKEAFLKYIKMGFNESLHMVEIIDNEIFHHGKKQDLTAWSRTIDDHYIFSIVADPQ